MQNTWFHVEAKHAPYKDSNHTVIYTGRGYRLEPCSVSLLQPDITSGLCKLQSKAMQLYSSRLQLHVYPECKQSWLSKDETKKGSYPTCSIYHKHRDSLAKSHIPRMYMHGGYVIFSNERRVSTFPYRLYPLRRLPAYRVGPKQGYDPVISV